MRIEDIGTVYFVGIGGIGMSALARYFLGRGVAVHGYDRTATPLTEQLIAEGARIHFEEDIRQIPPAVDLAVFTPAVPETHTELVFLREKGVSLHKRAEVLGMISRELRTLAVAGTHGKTTTSSMLAWLMHRAGLPVNAFLGGIANNFHSNYLGGPADWMVVEADEYDRSFLQLHPEVAVITSTDADHLDIYGSGEELLTGGFLAFYDLASKNGEVLLQVDCDLPLPPGAQYWTYGIGKGDFRAVKVRVEGACTVFDLEAPQGVLDTPDGELRNLHLPMPGRHNVENALAAIAMATLVGADPERMREALREFKGIQRRFDIRYTNGRVVYVDDYAHHPTELVAAIQAARDFFPGRKLSGVFQPHLYSRTRDFADGFARALNGLDETFLLEIYPAREQPIPGVSSALIAEQLSNLSDRVLRLDETVPRLREKEFEVLLTLGAGNIDTLVQPIEHMLEERFGPGEKMN